MALLFSLFLGPDFGHHQIGRFRHQAHYCYHPSVASFSLVDGGSDGKVLVVVVGFVVVAFHYLYHHGCDQSRSK